MAMSGRPMQARTQEIMEKIGGLRMNESVNIKLENGEVDGIDFMGFTQRCRIAAKNLGCKVSVRHLERGSDVAVVKVVGKID